MTILTAGYGNRGFGPFIELMKGHGVTHLVDVRSVPQSSYWEDFRRQRLEQIVPPTGLRYIYMGDTLGGKPVYAEGSPAASDEKAHLFCKADPSAVDLHPLFNDPNFRLGLEKLTKAAADPNRKICLICGCLRPHNCHRSRLIGEALVSEGVEVFHLDPNGNPVTQKQVMLESAPIQTSLF
ncbi:DUF488 family protein [Fimbriimonas ginsengisoli]|uniref:DUF488 domain-containing protein n=1 Tax=Fimbriimonas ginsengisoli Gsoil 348 TaxID=661478 RepID=A0A068NST0_FIMGI|nr:DUF488 domain-containing protein [Fimbriimonas ginsengisoli]AIE84674.1 hypothetical protein OP10G_1306 [Fimbriimonas ginsengisoli Gsoil 348]